MNTHSNESLELLKHEIIKNQNQQNKIQRMFKVIKVYRNSGVLKVIELTYLNNNNPKLISVVGNIYNVPGVLNEIVKNRVIQATKIK